MADVEVSDQKKYFEDSCKSVCARALFEYQDYHHEYSYLFSLVQRVYNRIRTYEACVKRIEGDDTGTKHCTGQYFDYWSCVDKCAAPRLFPKLK